MPGLSFVEVWAGSLAGAEPAPPEALRKRGRRLRMTALVGLSYGVDLAVIALFWRGGAAPLSLLPIYAAAAAGHMLVFGLAQRLGLSERAANPHLTGLQMAWAISLQFAALLWAPALAGYFLGVMFVIFSFGALRLPLRTALLMWLATSAAVVALMAFLPLLPAPLPLGSRWSRLGAAVGFSTLLLRCIVLNFRAMALRADSLRQATRLAAEAAEARRRASRDALTGALNRDGLLPLLEAELARLHLHGAPCCVAMLDIDWFKSVNDDWGHPAGDRLLRALVDLLQHHLRASDRLARLGGEEFLVLMPATAEREALDIAERLRELVAASPWPQVAPGLRLTLSVGVAQAQRSEGMERWLARADTALYGAKALGRNCCCVAAAVAA